MKQPLGILVVDDDHAVGSMLDLLLRELGCQVWVAQGGREALELYAQQQDRLDLVLLDVRMPDMDGPQTLRALQSIDPDIRCYFMSGDSGIYSENDLQYLAGGFLRKPFGLAQLAQILHHTRAAQGSRPDLRLVS